MRPDHFECGCCHRVFGKEVSDEEAMANSERTLGIPIDRASADPICPDCWDEFLAWAKPRGILPPDGL